MYKTVYIDPDKLWDGVLGNIGCSRWLCKVAGFPGAPLSQQWQPTGLT